MLVIWKERDMPWCARVCAGRRVMSAPEKRIVPASGSRLPASWPISVVLPAPFGPMMAWVSPSRTSKSIPSDARSAPKHLVIPRTSSIVLVKDAGEAAAEENHREDHLPVLGPAREQRLHHEQRERAEQRPGRGRDAAEDHHEHDLAGARPVHELGRQVGGVVDEQRPGEPA